MTTLVILHEVEDVDRWLSSSRRDAVLSAFGMTARTFVDSKRSNRVGLVLDCPDLETFQRALQSEEAADGMKSEGVRPETIVVLTEA
jgi:hypothetical protein